MDKIRWKNGCRLLCLAVVFLSVSLCASAKDPAEMSTQEILTELIALNEQKSLELNQREQALEWRETRLILRLKDLDEREASMVALGNFSKSLRNDLERKRTNDYWRGFLHGSIVGGSVGAVAGGFAGFKIGVNY